MLWYIDVTMELRIEMGEFQTVKGSKHTFSYQNALITMLIECLLDYGWFTFWDIA